MVFQQSFGAGAAVVTDRRLLLERGPVTALWGWQRIHDIPLGEIIKVSRVGRSWLATLTLVLADGRQLSLENIPKKDRLAKALNALAGAGVARDEPPTLRTIRRYRQVFAAPRRKPGIGLEGRSSRSLK